MRGGEGGGEAAGEREASMAGAAGLGEVPDHCWSQEQD